MSPYLRLTRPVNLLFIVLIQLLFRWSIVLPPLAISDFRPNLPWWGFLCLVFSTVLIAAAGYVVNDIYDMEIDRINKPNRVIIGEELTERQAWRYYWILNIVGFLGAVAAAVSIGKWRLATVQVIIAAILLFYAQSYKRKLLLGNILVALCAAMVIGIIPLYELNFGSQMEQRTGLITSYILVGAISYALFAFLSTLSREIIKDIEDIKGDSVEGANSIPIAWGEKTARIIAMAVLFITNLALPFMAYVILGAGNWWQMAPFSAVFLVGIIAAAAIFKAGKTHDYSAASTWLKVWMLAGVLSMLVFKFGWA